MSSDKTDGLKSGRALGETEPPDWLSLVRRQVESLKFGTVQITVHDSHVTQVERLEKVRLDRPK